VITLDLLLPEASGWDVLRKIRAGGPNREVNLVADDNKEKMMASDLEEDPSSHHPAKPVPVAAESRAQVLIVEDDPLMARMIAATLILPIKAIYQQSEPYIPRLHPA
jgi:CheY-like chemotaxis protein